MHLNVFLVEFLRSMNSGIMYGVMEEDRMKDWVPSRDRRGLAGAAPHPSSHDAARRAPCQKFCLDR